MQLHRALFWWTLRKASLWWAYLPERRILFFSGSSSAAKMRLWSFIQWKKLRMSSSLPKAKKCCWKLEKKWIRGKGTLLQLRRSSYVLFEQRRVRRLFQQLSRKWGTWTDRLHSEKSRWQRLVFNCRWGRREISELGDGKSITAKQHGWALRWALRPQL